MWEGHKIWKKNLKILGPSQYIWTWTDGNVLSIWHDIKKRAQVWCSLKFPSTKEIVFLFGKYLCKMVGNFSHWNKSEFKAIILTTMNSIELYQKRKAVLIAVEARKHNGFKPQMKTLGIFYTKSLFHTLHRESSIK